MKRRYLVSLAPGAREDLTGILAHYEQADRDYAAGSNIRGRFVEALSELQGKLAENPRAFPPIKEYRFSVLSRSFRYVVLFRVDEKNGRVRILGVFGPGQKWRPES